MDKLYSNLADSSNAFSEVLYTFKCAKYTRLHVHMYVDIRDCRDRPFVPSREIETAIFIVPGFRDGTGQTNLPISTENSASIVC